MDRLIYTALSGASQTLYEQQISANNLANVNTNGFRADMAMATNDKVKGGGFDTRYMAQELGPRGITVNTVAPGAIETDFGGGVVRDNADLNAKYAGLTALGRVGLPDDIGPMVASLLSDDNRWVTGQRIEVSGGQAI